MKLSYVGSLAMLMNKQVSSVDPVSSKWFLKNLAVLESILINIKHYLNKLKSFKLSSLLNHKSLSRHNEQNKHILLITYLLINSPFSSIYLNRQSLKKA